MDIRTHASAIVLAGAFVLPACKPTLAQDETNVASDFEGSQYEENIVTGRATKEYEDQGKGVSPRVISAIDHTIRNVYERDFERCMEDEMGRQETRFLRSMYTVEFTINTEGVVTAGKILEIKASKQNAKGSDLGPIDPTELAKCIEASVLQWEFDDKPEVEFKHTYRGQVGEAY